MNLVGWLGDYLTIMSQGRWQRVHLEDRGGQDRGGGQEAKRK